MSDDESPRPFRRERNLSNRNFNKRGSRRRISAESHSSVESLSVSTTAANSESNHNSTSGAAANSSSSSMHISYSVNSDTENAFNRKSLLKMIPASDDEAATNGLPESPTTPDPALLSVRQKLLRFETMHSEERIIFKTGKFKSKSLQKLEGIMSTATPGGGHMGPLRVLPVFKKRQSSVPAAESEADAQCASPVQVPTIKVTSRSNTNSISLHQSIDEERSEDDVDDFSDYAEEESHMATTGATKIAGGAEYVLPEEAHEVQELEAPSSLPGYDYQYEKDMNENVLEFGIDDFGKVETVRQTLKLPSASAPVSPVSPAVTHSSEQLTQANGDVKKITKDFKRNYRTIPRPKTDIHDIKNSHVIGKYNSLHEPKKAAAKHANHEEEEDVEIELRDKSNKFIQPILDELIKTEETYVENLFTGIKNYGHIFQRKDLPIGLRGKKYVLLGNIEQLAEFHRDEFLPMLQHNRRDLKRLFDEFQSLIDQNCFYGYVIFTMNKQRSLKLCEDYKNYFKHIQSELDDKLGINSFLVQPIQRMARYPLLLQQFISTLFKHRDIAMKPLLESCCRLEKKMRTLLTTTNESEVINDIVDCNEFNVFYQGKFRKVSEFHIFDHTLKRSYRGKVFIFDKCVIYTEIKGKHLIFHGRYPCEHIGIVSKTKSFTLFYERRKQQECEFNGDPALIEMWMELIRDMISSYVAEERQKLAEIYSRENDHLHRKPPSLSLFRDSNRFSSDSGIGNIWVMPKPEAEEVSAGVTGAGNRTTWYAVT